jgi:hypothetical protein
MTDGGHIDQMGPQVALHQATPRSQLGQEQAIESLPPRSDGVPILYLKI